MLGKRRMNSIMSREIGVPYMRIAASGRYVSVGCMEKLTFGGHTLRRLGGKLYISDPDYIGGFESDEELRYVTREILL